MFTLAGSAGSFTARAPIRSANPRIDADALRRGQMALFVAVDAYAQEVDAEVRGFDAERRQFVDQLRASSDS